MRWAISNAIVLVLLFLCWKNPRYGRLGFGVIFLSAGIVNTFVAIYSPQGYLEYRDFAIIEIYKTFIDGVFADNIRTFVLAIASGQLLIAIGMFYNKHLLKPALIGSIIFSAAVIPLGMGSGMPVPIIMIISLLVLYFKHSSHKNVIT